MAWFVVSIIGFLAALALFILRDFEVDEKEWGSREVKKKKVVVWPFGLIPLILSIAFILLATITTVDSGNVGVQTVFGKVQKTELSEGVHFVAPWIDVHQVSIRTQEYEISSVVTDADEGEVSNPDAIHALSSDGADLLIDVACWYRIDPTLANEVYQKIGNKTAYAEKMRTALRTSIRNSAKEFTAMEAFSTGKDAFQDMVLEQTRGLLNDIDGGAGIVVDQVNLKNITLPTKITDAINEKLDAEQAAQAMSFKLQQEEIQAEIRVVEATGLKEAQEIISASLTDEYLQWKYIETLASLVDSENNTVIVLPFDQDLTPLLNVTP